jgi:acyl-coenzyme A thioesterase PaaI-like protein
MAADALFELSGSRYRPTDRSLGPWGRSLLHGGPVAALLAHAVESQADGLLPVRLSIDLFRAVPMAPIDVEVQTLRLGSRVHVVAARLLQEGVAVSHGLGLFMRPSAEPAVVLPQSNGCMRPPETYEPVRVPREPISHATSLEIRGRMQHDETTAGNGLWIRTIFPVVDGHALTPFERAAIVSDWTNPVGNYGPDGINFINADITLYLHRAPRGDWHGLQLAARHSTDGIALSDCTMHDVDGPVGRCVTASLATIATASGKRPSGVEPG